jgi:hypothetical protein
MGTYARALLLATLVTGCSYAANDASKTVTLGAEPLEQTPGWAARPTGFAANARGLAYTFEAGRLALSTQPKAPRKPRQAPSVDSRGGAAIALETVALAREAGGAALASTPATVRADGALVIDRGVAVERLEQRLLGLAQSWKLAAKPAGGGDLVVRIRVDGATSVRSDRAGLVLSAGSQSFRYGLATWVDARGRSFPLSPTFSGGMIEIRVPSALVDASAFPATLDPLVSAESFGTPSAGAPRAAAGNSSDVTVWEDSSAAVSRIVSARVDQATGKVQLPFAIPVSGAAPAFSPAIAAADDRFLVAFRDDGGDTNAIRARWLDASGRPLGDDFAVSAPGESSDAPAVRCGDARCVIAWHAYAAGVFQVRAAFVDRTSGAVSSTSLSTSGDRDQYAPDVATDGTSFLVTWSSSRDDSEAVAGKIVGDVESQIVDLAAAPTWYRSFPRATFANGSYYVSYADARNDEDADVFVARIDAASAATLGETRVGSGAGDQDSPVLGATAGGLTVAYQDADGIHGATLDAAGAVTARSLVTSQSGSIAKDIASSGEHTMALWTAIRTASWEALGTRLATDAAPIDASPIAISSGPGTCTPVALDVAPSDASVAGEDVTMTASSTCTDATAEYQYWIDVPGLGTSLLRDFDAAPAVTWHTDGLPTDAYHVIVRSRRAGLFANWESEAEAYHGVIGESGTCSTVALQADPAGAVESGASVTLTAQPTCTASESAEVEFSLVMPNGTRIVLRDWGSPSFVWDTTGFPTTTLSLVARARRVGSSAVFESESAVPMLVFGGRGLCPTVTLSADSSFVAAGESTELRALASCTNDETAEYEFTVRPPSGGMQTIRSYGASPTATFVTGGVSGRYRVWVRTRRAGSSLPFEGSASTTLFVE